MKFYFILSVRFARFVYDEADREPIKTVKLRYNLRNRIADVEPPVPILKLRLELQTRFGLHRRRRRRRRRINREEGVMLCYYTAERVQRLSISILRRWRTHRRTDTHTHTHITEKKKRMTAMYIPT